MNSQKFGARGTALMAITGVAGILLGVHGWSARGHGLPPTGLSGSRPAASAAPTSAPARSSGPGPTATPTAGPRQGPTASASPTQSQSAAPKPGPKLSSQSYASYSFQIWPGSPSPAAKAAETGLVITVRKQGSGILVAGGVAGQAPPTAKLYPTGAHVYVVEASMGDDSGNSDFNLGDDGLIVTDAQGRILQ
jgi:hypothetical protein